MAARRLATGAQSTAGGCPSDRANSAVLGGARGLLDDSFVPYKEAGVAGKRVAAKDGIADQKAVPPKLVDLLEKGKPSGCTLPSSWGVAAGPCARL